MRIALSVILSILMLSFSQAPCGEAAATGGHGQMAHVQSRANQFPEGDGHCCPNSPDDGAQGNHCPPSCHCACCHSPVVIMVVKHELTLIIPETAKPSPTVMPYQSGFHHLIWHPPQTGRPTSPFA
ncbi:MAG: hypothetical protein H6557_21230 [Lewinellaceae bacterium]|nr:hypothetical protein [Phaeodactylibacter sp.]MCB9039142.1 hypothetical protein [Lewinellaceae bacterium]